VRPGAVALAPAGLPARVELVESLGDMTIVDVSAGGHAIKLRTPVRPPVREGDAVHVAFSPNAIHLFDASTGLRR
jgi:ABC-type sugar transport system ATPase subunit